MYQRQRQTLGKPLRYLYRSAFASTFVCALGLGITSLPLLLIALFLPASDDADSPGLLLLDSPSDFKDHHFSKELDIIVPPLLRADTVARLTTIEPGSTHEDLKSSGLKLTLPRQKILEILEKADPHHLSAEDVYRALLESGSHVGQATVYRVLTQFETAGLVTRHHFDGGQAVFELDTGDNHDHIVCMKTGQVAEFADEFINKRLDEIASELGYDLHEHKIVLYGEYTAKKAKSKRRARR